MVSFPRPRHVALGSLRLDGDATFINDVCRLDQRDPEVRHAWGDGLEARSAIDDAPRLDQRWRLALRGMHALLDDFALGLPARVALLRELRDALEAEIRVERAQKRQLGETYRNERSALVRLVAPSCAGGALAPGFEALRRRSKRLRPVVAELRACEAAGRLVLPLRTIVPSYLHMHANRLLRSTQRQQELIIYHLLASHYSALLHRGPGR